MPSGLIEVERRRFGETVTRAEPGSPWDRFNAAAKSYRFPAGFAFGSAGCSDGSDPAKLSGPGIQRAGPILI